MTRQGATYRIVSRVKAGSLDFLTRGSEQFRPVGLALSPDGLSWYVADWGTHLSTVRYEAGRLWQVTYTGKNGAAPKPAWHRPAALGQPCQATTEELLTGLRHAAQSVRSVAQRRLAEKGATVLPSLTTLLADRSAPAYARWSAIWALDRMDAGAAARRHILAALQEPDATVRRQAARQLGTRRAREAWPSLLPLLKDADASVRFQAATALGRIGAIEAVMALRDALEEEDEFARYAVVKALNRIGQASPDAWPSIVVGLQSSKPGVRQGTLFALRETWSESLVNGLLTLWHSTGNEAPTRVAIVNALGEIGRKPPPWDGTWWGVRPVTRPRPEKTQDWAGSPAVIATLRQALSDPDPAVRRSAITALANNHDTNSAPLLRASWSKETDSECAQAILAALGEFKDPELGQIVENLFKAGRSRSELLPAAATAAEKLDSPSMRRLLRAAVDSDLDPAALASVIGALGRLEGERALPIIARHLESTHPQVWRSALAALVAMRGEGAVQALLPLLHHPQAVVRNEAVMGLADLDSKTAVPALLSMLPDDAAQASILYALNRTPDVRALDVYLRALLSPTASFELREVCLSTLGQIQDEALPLIEERMASLVVPPDILMRLQHLDDGFNVIEWFLAGPFFTTNAEAQLLRELPADGQLRPQPGKTNLWRHVSGRPLTGRLEVRRFLNWDPTTTTPSVYAAVVIRDVRGVAEIELAATSEDPLTLWLNGRRVILNSPDRSASAQSAQHARVTLQPGHNSLMVRLDSVRSGVLTLRGSRPLEAQTSPETYAAFARDHRGDALRGRAAFQGAATSCSRCHRISGAGGGLGPDLTGVGAKYDREQLIEAVLQPSRQIAVGYEQTLIRTKDGEVVTGLLQAENATTLTLLDANGGLHSVNKSLIAERELNSLSLMPEGLHRALSLESFADLIAYLEALR
jgi:putative heme-binding domain-containing protein